ncbi:hypothetical protein BD560DRAFT_455253 [Blakeslea trispora]|nr:hypothetical protein BD560DRAFT_455253 [Blakeslea trispora]
MYSPPQQDYGLDTDHFSQQQQQQMGTPHTTVGAMPVVRNNRLFNPNYHHQRQNSFGTAASAITMSPPNNHHHRNSMGFHDNNNSQNWFGTSMDSNGSSFGQSPIFTNMPRELVVSPSTSSSHLDTFTVEMFEKRRRRRESHNAVERRRRDNINERIHDTAPTSSNVMSVSNGQVGANGRAINKGTILKLSVDHIKELREEVYRYQERIKELEQMIEAAKHGELIQETKPHFEGSASKHQRMGSIQFRQQFNDLQIGTNE